MNIATGNQAVILTHKWQGIASFIIGVSSIIITSLLFAMAMSGTEPLKPMGAVPMMFSSVMLCANLTGIVLGFFGARDHSSRKSFPLLGLALNVAILTTFVVLAVVGLSMKTP